MLLTPHLLLLPFLQVLTAGDDGRIFAFPTNVAGSTPLTPFHDSGGASSFHAARWRKGELGTFVTVSPSLGHGPTTGESQAATVPLNSNGSSIPLPSWHSSSICFSPSRLHDFLAVPCLFPPLNPALQHRGLFISFPSSALPALSFLSFILSLLCHVSIFSTFTSFLSAPAVLNHHSLVSSPFQALMLNRICDDQNQAQPPTPAGTSVPSGSSPSTLRFASSRLYIELSDIQGPVASRFGVPLSLIGVLSESS